MRAAGAIGPARNTKTREPRRPDRRTAAHSRAWSPAPARKESPLAQTSPSLARSRRRPPRLRRRRRPDVPTSPTAGTGDARRQGGRPEDQAVPARDLALAAPDGRPAHAEPQAVPDDARHRVPRPRPEAVAAAGDQGQACARTILPTSAQWRCLQRYEGSWTDSNDPYWGGLQMDRSFMRLMRRGTCSAAAGRTGGRRSSRCGSPSAPSRRPRLLSVAEHGPRVRADLVRYSPIALSTTRLRRRPSNSA